RSASAARVWVPASGRRTSTWSPSSATRAPSTPASPRIERTRSASASSTTAPARFFVTCTAGSFWNRFGEAYRTLSTTTIRMTAYFQRGNSSIAGFVCGIGRGPRGPAPCPPGGRDECARSGCVAGGAGGAPRPQGSGRLERALGQDVDDRALLHADLHPVGDLHGHEALAERPHHAADAAAGDDLVAHRQLLEHRPMLLLLLHLRPDHQEVHDRDQRDGQFEQVHRTGSIGENSRELCHGAGPATRRAPRRPRPPPRGGQSPPDARAARRAAWKDSRKAAKVPAAIASRIRAISAW